MSMWRLRFMRFADQFGTIAVTLLGLLMLTFFIGRMMPADPVRAIVGEDATR
ncbi:ABC-type dipeptide/oligopeptide/nickel transport system permease component, partial [Rhizobium sp. BIGb0125]|nr:ABC-type dipeptide/oligopeptide/nickel transport system permease component [Rhizobium sp. BIGb0125]